MINILIIAADKCDDSELLYPYYRVIEAGYTPTVASFERTPVNAKYHFSVMADISVEEIDVSAYDGLILPGGQAPEKLRQNQAVIDVVKSFDNGKKPIAAICHGQQILISAEVLKGRTATCYPGIKDDLINAGATYEDKPVVICKNLVTSRRPEDLPFFMKEFLKLIKQSDLQISDAIIYRDRFLSIDFLLYIYISAYPPRKLIRGGVVFGGGGFRIPCARVGSVGLFVAPFRPALRGLLRFVECRFGSSLSVGFVPFPQGNLRSCLPLPVSYRA